MKISVHCSEKYRQAAAAAAADNQLGEVHLSVCVYCVPEYMMGCNIHDGGCQRADGAQWEHNHSCLKVCAGLSKLAKYI